MSFGIKLPEFDTLVALHEQDPQAFEEFRRHLLTEAIKDAPARHRPALKQLLHRIESARTKATTPMEAAQVAMRMMNESLQRLHSCWEDAGYAMAGLQAMLLIERARR